MDSGPVPDIMVERTPQRRRAMHCLIYKSRKKEQVFVYCASVEVLTLLPPIIRDRLGALDRVMALTLQPQRKLAQASASTVLSNLRRVGYYVQSSDSVDVLEFNGRLLEAGDEVSA